jgi:hypothetical protein
MRRLFSLWIFLLTRLAFSADAPPARPPDAILADYVKAVGGLDAVDKITTRETLGEFHRGPKVNFYWQKPNLVLSMTKKERVGYDGTRGWILTKKKKIKKMARGAELPIEMDANPLRFVHIKDFYSELDPAPAEEMDGEKMEVILAPNNIAATKLYFDTATHLLRRVEGNGEVSAYFTNTVEFLDYKDVDGVKLPFHILHSTTEPGGESTDLRIKTITHNIHLQPEMFSKPIPGQAVMGGKR